MANTIKLSIKVDDDGSLSIVGRKAKEASEKLDNVTESSDKAGKSQNSLRRNLHGTANMTSNGTKQFAKMSQGITGGLVPAYAVLASNVFALSAAFNFLKRAADVQILEDSQVKFAQNSGVALQSITKRLREASDGMLGFQEAGQAAAIGLAKGFSPTQLEALAEGARKASTALGRDFQDSFDRLVRGASKAEPELLDELGITLRLEEATQKYADAIGKNRNELNSYQRSQAVLLETQRQLNKNFGDFEGATNPFVRLSKTFEDLIKKITQFFLPLFTGLANIINGSAVAAVAVFGGLGIAIFKAMVPLDGFNERITKMGENSVQSLKNASGGFMDYVRGVKEASKAVVQSKALGARGVQSGAQAMVDQGASSKTLKKAASGGTLSGLDKANISKALKSAEAQFKQHGEIRTGIFKGMNIKMVRDFGKSMDMMNAKGAGVFKRIGQVGVAGAKSIGVAYKAMSVVATGALVGVQKVAGLAAAGISKVVSFASGIGIAVMLVEMAKQINDNLFTIVETFAKVLDKIISFIAPFVNFMVRGFLGLVDDVVNGFEGLRVSLATVVNTIANGIKDGFESALNFVIEKLNLVIKAANKLPKINIPTLDNANLGGALILMDETAKAASNLAGEFEGINQESTMLVDMLRNSDFGAGLLSQQESTRIANAQNEAMKQYKDLLATGTEELGTIIRAMENSDDALKSNKMAFEALNSFDIPGLFAKIGAKTTEFVKQLDGTEKPVERFVFSAEQQKEALAALQSAFSDVSKVSPKLGRILKSATLGSGKQMEDLGTQITNTATQLAAFENGLADTKAAVDEAFKSSDYKKAFEVLNQLKISATDAAKGLKDLEIGSALAEDILERFKNLFGKDEIDADILLSNLKELVLVQNAIAVARVNAALATGTAAQSNTIFIAQQEEQVKLLAIEAERRKGVTAERERELTQDERIANAKLKILGVQKELVLAAKAEQFGATGEVARIQNAQNLTTELTNLANKMQQIREQDARGLLKNTTLEAEEFKIKMAMAGVVLQQIARDFNALAGQLANLGPDGQLLAGIATAFGNTIGTIGVAMEKFAENTELKFAKVTMVLTVVSAMLSSISQMMAAQSAQRIAGIDKEIAAEKKRDGKSKDSVAKIAQLEKKKDDAKRKAFEQQKKMAMAQIVIQTALSMISVAASLASIPFGMGLPMIPPAMAMMAALGAAMLAMAASTSYQGGGSVGGAPGGPSSISTGKRRDSVDVAKSQSAAGELAYMRGERGTGGPENFRPAFTGYKNRNYGGNTGFMVGEQGPELFVPDRPGTIVPADDTAQMGGALTANINITALDASGVEEVLTEQQGNIIGMIREAANSYGEDFLEGVDETIYTSPVARRA